MTLIVTTRWLKVMTRGTSDDDESHVNDEWENAMDMVNNEVPLSGEEVEVEQTDEVLATEIEGEASTDEQGDVSEEGNVDIPVET